MDNVDVLCEKLEVSYCRENPQQDISLIDSKAQTLCNSLYSSVLVVIAKKHGGKYRKPVLSICPKYDVDGVMNENDLTLYIDTFFSITSILRFVLKTHSH